jgi:hypothetical protein
MRSSARFPTWCASCRCFRLATYQQSTRGRHLWPRRDRELKGETRGTQFRQVQAARCVIPYVLYVVYLCIDRVLLQNDADEEIGVPASPYIIGRQSYKLV